MALQWEFPGGKIEPGESDQQALARELVEELDIRAEIGPLITEIRHTYRNGNVVDLKFFSVERFEGDLKNQIFEEIRWEKLVNLPQYDFLAADRGLVRDLAAGKLL
jgi:8-oxo-dGTP diphosphatase